MNYTAASEKLTAYRQQIDEIRKKMRAVQSDIESQIVPDYEFKVPDGLIRLSALFGNQADLIVVHNMGTSCPACTLWADGYNGLHQHVLSRAAFAVSSPDSPAVQQQFAASRGWKFRMVSHADTSFAADMGYGSAEGRWRPGISVFKREGSAIVRVSDAQFNPGDDFCTLYHFFDLLPGGVAGWKPKFNYG